jgi:phosphonate transport system substrate-binding protein
VPDQDKVLYSGKHDQTVMGGAVRGLDGGPVASDVFKRMIERGQVKAEDFRIIYRSQTFPTSSFAYAHDLEPKLRDTMLKCFYDFRLTAEMQKAFDGADRFYPITYKEHWAVVRQVAECSGEKFNKAAYDNLAKGEAEAAAKKAQKK